MNLWCLDTLRHLWNENGAFFTICGLLQASLVPRLNRSQALLNSKQERTEIQIQNRSSSRLINPLQFFFYRGLPTSKSDRLVLYFQDKNGPVVLYFVYCPLFFLLRTLIWSSIFWTKSVRWSSISESSIKKSVRSINLSVTFLNQFAIILNHQSAATRPCLVC